MNQDCSYSCKDYIEWCLTLLDSGVTGTRGCYKSNSPFNRCNYLPDPGLLQDYKGKSAEEIILLIKKHGRYPDKKSV